MNFTLKASGNNYFRDSVNPLKRRFEVTFGIFPNLRECGILSVNTFDGCDEGWPV